MMTERKSRFPWYKERLKWKYIQNLDADSKLCCNKWQFLPHNTDDFRSGLPVKQQFRRSKKGLAPPVIDDNCRKSLHSKTSSSSNIMRHDSTIYSRTAPRILKQKSQVEQAESSLQEHPLGLYPHLEDSLPAEISDEVLQILDPCLRADIDSFPVDEESFIPGEVGAESHSDKLSDANVHTDPAVMKDEETTSTIYRFPLKKSKQDEILEAKEAAKQTAISPEQEEAVDSVMQDLVDWTKKLGDEDDYISEATIKKLFTSDYESKPVLTAPIHVMELVSNIPHGLQPDSRGTTPSPSTAVLYNYQNALLKKSSSHVPPKVVKGKYGAWYLDIRLWKYRPHDEPLQDPREVDQVKDAAKKAKNLMLDNALLDTHGASAFRDFFISRQNGHVPKFLRTVGRSGNKARTF